MRVYIYDKCKNILPIDPEKPCYNDCRMYDQRGAEACEEKVLVLIWSTNQHCNLCYGDRAVTINADGRIYLARCDCGQSTWQVKEEERR